LGALFSCAAGAPFPAWLAAGREVVCCCDLFLSADPFDPPEKASVSLRTTGASMVEDADLTNSPISWSLAITTLLSTPNSLASS